MRLLRCSGNVNRGRVYDYLLDGDHYLPFDEVAAQRFLKKWPGDRLAAITNRSFQRRACLNLNQQEGISQLLNIGAGLPTQENTHQIVSACYVVYVDHDPDVVAVARLCLKEKPIPNVAYIEIDFCNPDSILWDRESRRLVDLSKPVGVVLGAVLHYVVDHIATSAIKTLASRLAQAVASLCHAQHV